MTAVTFGSTSCSLRSLPPAPSERGGEGKMYDVRGKMDDGGDGWGGVVIIFRGLTFLKVRNLVFSEIIPNFA